MPTCCYVPGCKSGYRSTLVINDEKLSFFSPPKDKKLFQQWAKVIPRLDKPLTPKDRVCSLHFTSDQVVKFFQHRINGEDVQLVREKPILATGAVPCIFPNLPAYYSRPPAKRKLPPIRFKFPEKKQKVCIAEQVAGCVPQPVLEETPITSIQDLIENLKNITFPSALWGCHVNSTKNVVAFSHMLDSGDSLFNVDRVVNIDESLQVKLECLGKRVQIPAYCIGRVYELHHVDAVLKCIDNLSFCQGMCDDLKMHSTSKLTTVAPIFSNQCLIILDKTKSTYAKRRSCVKCYRAHKQNFRRATSDCDEKGKMQPRKLLQQQNRRLSKKLQDLQKEIGSLKEECAAKVNVPELLKGFSANQQKSIQAKGSK